MASPATSKRGRGTFHLECGLLPSIEPNRAAKRRQGALFRCLRGCCDIIIVSGPRAALETLWPVVHDGSATAILLADFLHLR
eukprot:COSAG05_NODE_17178_length_330_cov_0.761905_1_plen_81_part_01